MSRLLLLLYAFDSLERNRFIGTRSQVLELAESSVRIVAMPRPVTRRIRLRIKRPGAALTALHVLQLANYTMSTLQRTLDVMRSSIVVGGSRITPFHGWCSTAGDLRVIAAEPLPTTSVSDYDDAIGTRGIKEPNAVVKKAIRTLSPRLRLQQPFTCYARVLSTLSASSRITGTSCQAP